MTQVLSTRYASMHPSAVATVLNEHPRTEIIRFLDELEPEVAAGVARHLASNRLKSSLQNMAANRVADILMAAEHDDYLVLVAHLSTNRYAEILTASGENQKLKSKLYGYSARSIGAIASPLFISVRKEQSIADILHELDSEQDATDIPIFVIDNDRLAGTLSPIRLLASRNTGESVESLMSTVSPLRDNTQIDIALNASQWLDHNILPVVDRNNVLMGVVTRKQLQQTISAETIESVVGVEEIAVQMARGYLNTCASLLDVLVRERK